MVWVGFFCSIDEVGHYNSKLLESELCVAAEKKMFS
jgi:hypothetical protein